MENNNKYPKVPLATKGNLDFDHINIVVEEKLVGEMWSNATGEFAPVVSKKIIDIRENFTDNSDKENKEKLKK
jgi:hypothetical protein